MRSRLEETLASVAMGPPTDFRNFMAAVIDQRSFQRIGGFIDEAKASSGYELIHGGGCDGEDGWFIEPTVVRTDDPEAKLMTEEIFGPVLTVFVYDDARIDEAVALAERTSPYALTGAIFGADRAAIAKLATRLPLRRRQPLSQRQADRRRGRPAALRRRARVRHQRQGRLAAEPAALALPARDQGELRAADRRIATRSWVRSSSSSKALDSVRGIP